MGIEEGGTEVPYGTERLRAPFPYFDVCGITTGMVAVDAEAFWSKVEKLSCWVWKAARNEKGYGVFGVNGRTFKAHRVAYELQCGPIPLGLCVLHQCDTPACVNPSHLFLGSRADNNADMVRKGRHVAGGTYCRDGRYARGAAHHNARLTPDLVREIRARRHSGVSFSSLAAAYELSIGHVFRIVNRQAWRDVE